MFCAFLQSPGQYYFKPMMKEFRFEPSSQMIEVQEGQNLKIQIIGYRTAYRSVELESTENAVGCVRMCCAKCVSSQHTSVLAGLQETFQVSMGLKCAVYKYFLLAFFHGCGYIAKPRGQSCRKNMAVSVALEVFFAVSSGRGLF